MEEPDRRETNGRERAEGSTENDPAEDPTQEVPAVEASAEDAGKDGVGAEFADADEHRRRLEAKDWHIRELYDEVTTLRLVADEAVAKAESDKSRVEDLEEERARLKERLGALEEEERGRRRQREGQDRRVARLERELERREAEIQRLEDLLESREDAFDEYGRETQKLVSRKDVALDNALSRIEGLQRDLEERENEAAELRTTVDELRTQLDLAYERRRRVAEPSNRLRSGIDLFNDSEHLQSVDSISRSLGLPEVRVFLGEEGNEPQVILTFTWGDVARRTYFANPGLAVEGPRVYQVGADEDPPGAEREPPNAHLGPDGRVFLGL